MAEFEKGVVSPASRSEVVGEYPLVAWAAMARTAGRYPESRFYDDLAGLVTRGALDAQGLLEFARDGHGEVPDGFDARGLAWFAYVTASRVESPTRVADAVNLFDLALRAGGPRIFAKQLDFLWVQLLQIHGKLNEYESALKSSNVHGDVWWAAYTDTLHPSNSNASLDQWLELLSQPLREVGLEPVELLPDAGNMFDRVSASTDGVKCDAGPLVSVVVPVFNPGPSIRTAVRSLVSQSWGNLEILLCDDASTKNLDLLHEMSELDDRIRVVRSPVNRGAYAARNMGLGYAQGEFVTFNDADDWSHPRRVERQMRAIEGSAARASMSQSIRVTEQLRLTVVGRPPRRLNLSSMLFRREDVLTELGGFDAVRRGADSEFVNRFRTVFGASSIMELEEPLSLVQLTSGSLSRDDYRFLRTHPARLQYVANFRSWHSNLRPESGEGYIAPGARAPFPAPEHIEGTATTKLWLDVLVLANLSKFAPTVPDLSSEMKALHKHGFNVGVAEYLAPFDATDSIRLPRGGSLARLISTGAVHRILPGARVECGAVVVRDPAAVEAMPDVTLEGVRASKIVVVADYHPEGGLRYCPDAVSERLQRILGGSVRWVPATSEIGIALRESIGEATVSSPCLIGAFEGVGAPMPWHEKPRIGVVLGSVQRMGGRSRNRAFQDSLPAVHGQTILTWGPTRALPRAVAKGVVHANSNIVSASEFVRSVDVVIVPRAPGRGAHLDRTAVAAMASGRIVMLDRSYQAHFGDAALYLGEVSVDAHIDRLVCDPDCRKRLQERALEFVRTELSGRTYVESLSSVLEERFGESR